MGVDRATSLTHCYTVVGELQSDLQPCRPRGTTRFHSSDLLIIARTELRAKTGHRRNCCGNLGQQSPKLFSWEVYNFQQLRIEKNLLSRVILLCSLLLVYSKCRTLQSVRCAGNSHVAISSAKDSTGARADLKHLRTWQQQAGGYTRSACYPYI